MILNGFHSHVLTIGAAGIPIYEKESSLVDKITFTVEQESTELKPQFVSMVQICTNKTTVNQTAKFKVTCTVRLVLQDFSKKFRLFPKNYFWILAFIFIFVLRIPGSPTNFYVSRC